MAKKDQESQEKQVLTEWQKRNLEFLRKKETEDSEEFTNGKVVHPEGATSNESQPSVKKKVKKKKRTKKKKRKKGNTSSNIPIAQQNLAGLVIFIAALLIVFSLFFISPWSKQKFLTVSGTKNALPEDVKVASGILDTDYITHVFFNQGKIASTVEKTNVWVKKATVTYSFPNQFNIAVKEYPIVAYRQTTNGYVSILESGKTGGTVSTSNRLSSLTTRKLRTNFQMEVLLIWKLDFIQRLLRLNHQKLMGIKRKTKIRLIKRMKIQLLKKIKILQHQLNSILRKSLILKIRVFKDKKIQLLVKKQLFVLPLPKANIE